MERLQIALYPLGFIASLIFGCRFCIQWLHSERIGHSHVPKIFWQLSLYGNLLLATHSFIQMQVHVLVIQLINGGIALRNLHLMQKKGPCFPLKKALLTFAIVSLAVLLSYTFFSFFAGNGSLFRVPQAPWNQESTAVSFLWHFVGILGLVLFGSRFILQWIVSEIQGKSTLGKSFWWVSLIGDLLCLMYFIKLGDIVNTIGPLFGLIPYLRNLMLIYQSKRLHHEA